MKIVAISDTHMRHDKLIIPPCDILISAGDWTNRGEKHEVEKFAKWINNQPAQFIVLSPGNHEKYLEEHLPESRNWFTENCPRAYLLIEESVTIEGIKIFGSPIQPFFFDWAWNRAPSDQQMLMQCGYGKVKLAQPIKPHWDAIPDDTNILITHGPPYGILDQTTYANGDPRPEHLGCELLMNRIKELKDLDLHFFGHIHHPGGNQVHRDGVSYYNSAICDEIYAPTNPITVVDYIK